MKPELFSTFLFQKYALIKRLENLTEDIRRKQFYTYCCNLKFLNINSQGHFLPHETFCFLSSEEIYWSFETFYFWLLFFDDAFESDLYFYERTSWTPLKSHRHLEVMTNASLTSRTSLCKFWIKPVLRELLCFYQTSSIVETWLTLFTQTAKTFLFRNLEQKL